MIDRGLLWTCLLVTAGGLMASCASSRPFESDPTAAIHPTRPPSNSMIFVAKTDSGVVAVDLGWSGRPQSLIAALDRIQARPADVVRVFLTHSHRDHVALWPWLDHARFHLHALEVPYFTGQRAHVDTGSRAAEFLHSSDYPEEGRLRIEGFGRDTTFHLGSDTIRAFEVPGHTEGSVAYVFRGTVFLGDAVSDGIRGNLGPPMGVFSNDADLGRTSIQQMLRRIDASGLNVEWACSAHATCEPYEKLRAEFEDEPPGS